MSFANFNYKYSIVFITNFHMKSKETIEYIINWIKNYVNDNKLNGLVIGVSGGVDSALTSTLCAMTGIKTICLNMPIHQDEKQITMSKSHIKWLKNKFNNVESSEIDLTNFFEEFKKKVDKNYPFSELALANSRSRMRMITLYYYAAINNSIVVGTGNKVEDFGIGFYTKYGDGGVDISPIADLMKSEVFELSRCLNISEEIINAKPTDGLWDDGRTDEDQIGIDYDDIENIMYKLEKGENPKYFDEQVKKHYSIYKNHNQKNKHKMIEIPICKIPDKLKL